MDAEYGIIYCSKCNDYIYDPLNEQILLKAYINLGNSIDSLSLFFPWIPNQKELNLLNNFCCNNDPNESIINTNTSQTTYNNIKKRKYTSEYKMNLPLVNFDHSTFNSSSLGLRGLINLGNTCFMNCILQAFIHVPVFKCYFLNDLHSCKMPDAKECLLCELASLFQEFYSLHPSSTFVDSLSSPIGQPCYAPSEKLANHSNIQNPTINQSASAYYCSDPGRRVAHAPNRFLHLVWSNARHLSGYEQQDAHEFFIAALDVLHRHARGIQEDSLQISPLSNPRIPSMSHVTGLTNHITPFLTKENSNGLTNENCNCIIDQIFTGSLQSDVTCQNCKSISTTIDPFWDISLDLGEINSTYQEYKANNLLKDGKPNSSSNAGYGPYSQDTNIKFNQFDTSSLEKCLLRFTCRENLGSQSKIKCSNCKTYQESTKQLTMRKLPIVACFHLKRFEHSIQNHKKISKFVSFPEELDMTPFLASCKDGVIDSRIDIASNKYLLFAVVNHIGNLDSGHYACYVKNNHSTPSFNHSTSQNDNSHKANDDDKWFKCNDHCITPASLKEVLGSEGYLLFYQKIYLHYKEEEETIE
ncbi:ubiquitin carboxyl-terminal hydrolase 27-like isoform X3 [Gordionus sp. m RMFG-2023]